MPAGIRLPPRIPGSLEKRHSAQTLASAFPPSCSLCSLSRLDLPFFSAMSRFARLKDFPGDPCTALQLDPSGLH